MAIMSITVQHTDGFPTGYRNVDFRVRVATHYVRYVNVNTVLKMTNSMGDKKRDGERK